jgi:homoserine O-acetyltransferase
MRLRSRPALLLACCAALVLTSAGAQIAPELAPQQFAQLGAITLENKAVIEQCAIGYRTIGKLNAQRSNAVVVLTWHTGKSADLLSMLGPKGLFDPTPYYVVLIDAIGNGVSCSPSNSTSQHGTDFPVFSIGDMVGAQHRLLTERLNLPHVRAVMGYSMGGMQTFQWMVSHPDYMDVVIALSGTPRMSSSDLLFWRTEELLMQGDPDYANGKYASNPPLAALQLVFAMNFTTAAHRNAATKPEELDKFIAETIAFDPAMADANDWRWQTRAMLAHDIGAGLAGPGDASKPSLALAAAKVRARVHVVVARQDHLVNPQAALDFAKLLKAPSTVLEGDCGHLAVNCEMPKVRAVVERALKASR